MAMQELDDNATHYGSADPVRDRDIDRRRVTALDSEGYVAGPRLGRVSSWALPWEPMPKREPRTELSPSGVVTPPIAMAPPVGDSLTVGDAMDLAELFAE